MTTPDEWYRRNVEACQLPRTGVSLGALRLANARKPFERPASEMSDSIKAQIRSIFGADINFERAFAGEKQDDLPVLETNYIARLYRESDMKALLQVELVDVVDAETNSLLYDLVLFPYGHGVVFEARQTTRIIGISQHGLDESEHRSPAWVSDFARAWLVGAESLGLWPGHIAFTDEELGTPAVE